MRERTTHWLQNRKRKTAPPCAIVVRFLDYRVKGRVIQQAWKQKITYEGRTVYFNQGYTNEILKKKKQVRDVIKKRKQKNVKAQSPYPAQLKVFLESGAKTFTSLTEAMLKDLGKDEMDKLQRVMEQGAWTTVTGQKEKRRQPRITESDLQALVQ